MSKTKKSMFNKKAIQKVVEASNRLQAIQMIVWEYMDTPRLKRDGVKMAMKIDKLYARN